MPVGAITWLSLARQYARAKERVKRGDHDAMQVFYNTRLGLSYKTPKPSPRPSNCVPEQSHTRARAARKCLGGHDDS